MTTLTLGLVILLVAVMYAALGVRVVQQYERGIVFRFGKVQDNVRAPGLALIVPIMDRMRKVNLLFDAD